MISNHEGGAKGTYWYFRFTDHFFDDLDILRMENLPANAGYEYIVILLKLYCLSTRSGGFVKIRTSFDGQIDYTLLSDELRHKSRETVYAAVSYFISVGLIQIMEAVDFTTFFAPGVKNAKIRTPCTACKAPPLSFAFFVIIIIRISIRKEAGGCNFSCEKFFTSIF